MIRTTILFAVFLLFPITFAKQALADYAKGKEAYAAGDHETAFAELMASAETGDAASQEFVGFMYSEGQGVPQNVEEALRWYRLSADQGFAPAQTRLGNHYQYGMGVRKNEAEGMRWFRLAADQGNVDAQYALGLVYAKGDGVKKNNKEAVRWYQLAADQGSPYAQNSLGELYYSGKGVKKNREEAARLYRLSAEAGIPVAQTNLGELYEKGRGVDKDKLEAERWYQLAAEQGNAKGQYALGRLLYSKRGVRSRSISRGRSTGEHGYKYKIKGNDQNQVVGYAWIGLATRRAGFLKGASQKMFKASLEDSMGAATLFKARRLLQEWRGNDEIVRLNALADSGDPMAQFELGDRHASGSGVLKNPYLAYHWMNLAAANGIKDANKRRKKLCKKIKKDDERMGPPGLDYLAIEHFEAHPEAFPAHRIRPILNDLCSG